MYSNLHNNVYAPVRKIDAQVDIYKNTEGTINGTLTKELTHTPEGHLKGITINRDGDNTKFFGYGVIQKATVRLSNVKNIAHRKTYDVMKIKFKSGKDEAYFNKYPNFFITETHVGEDMNEQNITAYDVLYFASLIKLTEIILTPPYTIKDVATAITSKLGLSAYEMRKVVNTSAFDLSYPKGANFEGEDTLRDVLDDIAEATQTIYFIEDNKLIFKGLSSANDVINISKEDYFTLDAKDNRKLTNIVSATELGDNVEAPPEVDPIDNVNEVSTGQIGSTQYVRDNGFWVLREDIAQILENAIASIGNLTLAQFNLEWRGNYLTEIGDRISISCNDTTINGFILNDSIEYEGGLVEKTQWEYSDNETEEATNPSTLGDALNRTFARVDKANKEITQVVSKVEENSNNLSSLTINTDSITQSVSQIQKNVDANVDGMNNRIDELSQKVNLGLTTEDVQIEISKQITQGVDRVNTSTGYKFNDEGLSISKDTTDISTTITEDGMKILQNNDALLTADHSGVDATNLHATTYLIIGGNSRFEDYDSGSRTGCFWIGN